MELQTYRLPYLSDRDPAVSAEGALDPLGLYSIADALALRLAPGLRERQAHPRFLTAYAVSLELCKEFGEETLASDGISEPWQVFEWYLVEGLVRTRQSRQETRGLPGSDKAEQAIKDGVSLSAARYLKTPRVFGFHGVYRLLARTLRVEEGERLGEVGYQLLEIWSKEQGLDGFVGTGGGPGRAVRRQLSDALRDGLQKGAVARGAGWSGWSVFRKHLDVYGFGREESRFVGCHLIDPAGGFRGPVIQFLISQKARELWEQHESERVLHEALRETTDPELQSLLDAISCYERFARLLQDSFDDCLYEMSQRRTKVSAQDLAKLPSIQSSAGSSKDLWSQVFDSLVPVNEAVRFQQTFPAFAETSAPEAWVGKLLDHHRKVQRQKPPAGKNPWFETFDDGSVAVRPMYRRDEPAPHDGSYVHAYRTNSLFSFLADLGMLN